MTVRPIEDRVEETERQVVTGLVDSVRHRYGREEHQRRIFEVLGNYDKPGLDDDAAPAHSFLDSLPPLYRIIVEGIAAGATRAELAERLGTNVATTQRLIRHIRRLYASWDDSSRP